MIIKKKKYVLNTFYLFFHNRIKKDKEGSPPINEEKNEKPKENLDSLFLFDPRMDKMKNFTIYFPHNNACVSTLSLGKSVHRDNRKITASRGLATKKSFKTNKTKMSRPSILSLKRIFK